VIDVLDLDTESVSRDVQPVDQGTFHSRSVGKVSLCATTGHRARMAYRSAALVEIFHSVVRNYDSVFTGP